MEDKELIVKVWEQEQEILDVFHTICKNNNLRYSLAYGTLIGAVRHRGFIPWDDDIDVMMPRNDYEKLMEVWEKEAPQEYIMQNYENTDTENNFAKIRKDHTTFLQHDCERNKKYHKGIFIDIFPGDRVPRNPILKKIQYIACAVNLLFSRGYPSGAAGVVGHIERVLLRIKPAKQIKYRKVAERVIKRWNHNKNLEYVFACTITCARTYYPASMFDKMVLLPFNGKEYCAVEDYDSALRIEYGDYRKLPPKNERVWTHHPLIIDFEHNYEELLK